MYLWSAEGSISEASRGVGWTTVCLQSSGHVTMSCYYSEWHTCSLLLIHCPRFGRNQREEGDLKTGLDARRVNRRPRYWALCKGTLPSPVPPPVRPAGPVATWAGKQGRAGATPCWYFISAMARAGGKASHWKNWLFLEWRFISDCPLPSLLSWLMSEGGYFLKDELFLIVSGRKGLPFSSQGACYLTLPAASKHSSNENKAPPARAGAFLVAQW